MSGWRIRASVVTAAFLALGCTKPPPAVRPEPAEAPAVAPEPIDRCLPFALACYEPRDSSFQRACLDPDPVEVPFERNAGAFDRGFEHLFADVAEDRADWKPGVRLRLVAQHDPEESATIDAQRIEAVRRELIGHGIDAARIVTVGSSPLLPKPWRSRNVRIVAEGCAQRTKLTGWASSASATRT